MWNENWIKGEDYPAWGDNDIYKKTISGGYLYQDETPREAYHRVAKTVARRLYKPEMSSTFLIISGMVGCVLLAQFLAIPELIAACLLVALVLMWLTQSKILGKRT